MSTRTMAIAVAGGAVAAAILLTTATGSATPAAQAPAAQGTLRLVPDDLRDTSWLQQLAEAQGKAVAAVTAFHDFRFADGQAASGLAFQHRVVADAAITYKAAHYDHGTGIAIADVDGDGLIDIYFVNQIGGNQLWKNAGGGKFQDITAAAGVGVAGRVGVSASFADIDNDGDADLYATTVRGGNMLFENDGRGLLRLRPRRPPGRLPRQRRTVYDGHARGRGQQVLRGVRGRVHRSPEAGTGRTEHLVPQRGGQPLR